MVLVLGGTGVVDAWAERGVRVELGAGAGGAALTGAGAAAVAVVVLQAAAGGAWDEEGLPCYSVERAAEVRSCGGLADPENTKHVDLIQFRKETGIKL